MRFEGISMPGVFAKFSSANAWRTQFNRRIAYQSQEDMTLGEEQRRL